MDIDNKGMKTLKTATWNINHAKTIKHRPEILKHINGIDADILILTETRSAINPGNDYSLVQTSHIPNDHADMKGYKYEEDENRTSIWTKYSFTNFYETYDRYTSVCADISTPFGLLTVYGTIIGVFGFIGPSRQRFEDDLTVQAADFNKLLPNKNAYIAGDYNIYFTGWPAQKKANINTITDVFKKLEMTNLTESIIGCDHIAISNDFLKNKKISGINTWDNRKTLSDHFGICVTLTDEE